MNQLSRFVLGGCLLLLLTSNVLFAEEITSVKKGKWGSTSTWSTGTIPTAADNVTISIHDTVTVDTTWNSSVLKIECNNLTIDGDFRMSRAFSDTLTIHGNLLINSTGRYAVNTNTVGGDLVHWVTLYGNLSNNGTFDMKTGATSSNPHTLSIVHITFTGSTNSVVTTGLYLPGNNEFGGITINKSDSARVVLHSDMYFPSGNSGVTANGGNPVLTFVHGMIETGPYAVIHLWTSSSAIVGGSDTTGYVMGNLGRGITTNQTTPTPKVDRTFQLGDATGYHPIKARSMSSGLITGHYVLVQSIDSAANTGASTLPATIDKVSGVRYYKLSYFSGVLGAPPWMTFDRFAPSYSRGDGVAAGNTNLRVAFSSDGRATWSDQGPILSTHTTSLDTVPKFIYADSLLTGFDLNEGAPIYIALGRAAGTTENTLERGTDGIHQISSIPAGFSLAQNYPNPFNPSTSIEFSIPKREHVVLRVFNVLGQSVATLVNGEYVAGSYVAEFDAAKLSSGAYFYSIQAGEFSRIKRMVVLK